MLKELLEKYDKQIDKTLQSLAELKAHNDRVIAGAEGYPSKFISEQEQQTHEEYI